MKGDWQLQTIRRTFQDLDTTGEQTVISGISGKVIRVLALHLRAGLGTTASFKSNGNKISSDFVLTTNDETVFPFNPAGWFETAEGEDFRVDQSGVSVNSGINIVWIAI